MVKFTIKDHIQRGDYTKVSIPRIVFSLFRITDPLIGILLLIYWVEEFADLTDLVGNWQSLTFLACVTIAVIHQLYWVWFLSRERFTWFMALFPWNNLLDWIWVYFLSSAINNKLYIDPWVVLGAAMFIMGISVELVSNYQLQKFKSVDQNQGRLYTGGLFSLVIHPNYAGYILWRSALPLLTGYPILAGISLIFHIAQFYFHAHPLFQRYMHAKYGETWDRYIDKRKKIFPGIL